MLYFEENAYRSALVPSGARWCRLARPGAFSRDLARFGFHAQEDHVQVDHADLQVDPALGLGF